VICEWPETDMSLTPTEAHSALKNIEKTENRTAAAQHGRYAAPHLISWGVVWVIGYLAGGCDPRLNWVWAPLIVAGVIASLAINLSTNRGQVSGYGWRYGASFAAIFACILALFLILPP
jgi:hypothetical protein